MVGGTVAGQQRDLLDEVGQLVVAVADRGVVGALLLLLRREDGDVLKPDVDQQGDRLDAERRR